MKAYAFFNLKGGVGKTSLTMNMGGYLASAGNEVLLIDCDPQASLSINFGIDEPNAAMDDVILSGQPISDVIQQAAWRDGQLIPNLHIAPGHINLAQADMNMTGYRKEYRLADALATVHGYDYVLIDCPPTLGVLSVNCLVAAQFVVMPSSCDYQSLRSIRLCYDTILDMQKQLNPALQIAGLAQTRYTRTTHANEVKAAVTSTYGDVFKVYKTVLGERVAVKDAALAGQFVYQYAPNSATDSEYAALCQEIFNA